MPDPSILVTGASSSRPFARSRRKLDAVRARTDPQPRRQDRLGPGSGWASGTRCVARWPSLGYPTGDIEVERFLDPQDWQRMGMERGTPFALAHRFFQTGPFRAGTSTTRCRGWCSSVRGRAGRGGSRWCCCRAGWPPTGSTRWHGRADDRRIGVRQIGVWQGRTRPAGVCTGRADRYCRRLNRRYGTTYYWSTCLLPRDQRPHVHAVYGFCRYADDIVDDLGSTASPEKRRECSGLCSATGSSPTSSVVRRTISVLDAVVDTVQSLRHRRRPASGGSSTSMDMDFTSPDLRDVRRAPGVHGRLCRRHR